MFFFVQFSQFLFVFSFFCSSCNISFHSIPMFVFNVFGVVAVAVVDGGAGAGGVLSPDCFRNAFSKVLILKQIIKNSYKFFL